MRDKSHPSAKGTDKKKHVPVDMENHVKKDASACAKSLDCTSCVEKLRANYRNMYKKIAPWCALAYCKLQESYQRCEALCKSRMPAVKVYAG